MKQDKSNLGVFNSLEEQFLESPLICYNSCIEIEVEGEIYITNSILNKKIINCLLLMKFPKMYL